MRDFTLEETLLGKSSFERHAAAGGVTIKHYHADNGRYADKGFRDAIINANQTISYCGVGAHHQNGMIERRIKELTLGARTCLLHAMRLWPEMIPEALWPFAIKCEAQKENMLIVRDDGRTAEETFFGIPHSPIDPKNLHTFG